MDDYEKFNSFDNISDAELNRFIKAMGTTGAGTDTYEWWKELRTYAKERGYMKAGVLIITKCGGKHHVEPSQEVAKIYVDGKKVYSK